MSCLERVWRVFQLVGDVHAKFPLADAQRDTAVVPQRANA